MKIGDIFKNKVLTTSFEVFPPNDKVGLDQVYNCLDTLTLENPDFISVTYGAGGNTKGRTVEIAERIKSQNNVESLAHFTCIGSKKEEIDRVLNELEKNNIENILALKQNIAVLKKFISPVRELISKLQTRSMLNYFHEDMKYYLGDLNDHGIIVFDTVDMLNNRATELIQLYHSMISNTMNEIMKILAIISTIFMPLSFIVGLYGMNFEYMPELKWHYGYYITLGLMASLVILMIFYFKKKKWF